MSLREEEIKIIEKLRKDKGENLSNTEIYLQSIAESLAIIASKISRRLR